MKIEIIAEIAQGYEGHAEQASLLLKASAAAGADAAKYQLIYADELATPDYKYYNLFKTLEMPDRVWEGLATNASELGIELQLDIFGKRSLKLAEKICVKTIKLHGTDIANIGLLFEVANSSVQRVLLGAGGAFASELNQALHILSSKQIVVLIGFQGYPTPEGANQITRISLIIDNLHRIHPNISAGFADHAPTDSPLRYALAATALGVGSKVIEKHITLSQVMKLEDHESAMNPDQFTEFTKVIRSCADALGETNDIEDFGMSKAEKKYRKMIRRHAVSSRDLPKGTTITPSDLVLKRTSAEHVITDLTLAYQKKLNRDVKKNAPISSTDFD